METKQSIGEYIGKNQNRFFRIPSYQRGYKWGELKSDQTCDASVLLQDILDALENKKAEYFIQGVTVYENGNDIVLIDGQQRTTTLFLLLSLILDSDEKRTFLFQNKEFKLIYDIRLNTFAFLKSICSGEEVIFDSQDEFFIHQAHEKMRALIPDDHDKKLQLKDYILNKVKLFYIKIPEEHATKVFTMLNGAKAYMTTDELVKSAFLSEATKQPLKQLHSISLDDTLENLKTQIGEEWHTTTLRSRFARQWDKWMYWWNKPEVRAFFHCGSNPMGLLLPFFFKYNSPKGHIGLYSNNPSDVAIVFKEFQNLFINDPTNAKLNFEKLRKLQKSFEDLFNLTFTYNYLGLTLAIIDQKQHDSILHFFIHNYKDEDKLKRFALYIVAGIPQNDILNENNEEIQNRLDQIFALLNLEDVYYNDGAKELAFRFLFLLNVLSCNDRKSKFDFHYKTTKGFISFYANRSLEHIWPKSRVLFYRGDEEILYKTDEKGIEEKVEVKILDGYINRSDFSANHSEHCIGNLLFLHKTDNSVFNAKLPEMKKLVYFDLNLERAILSRNLLHTMSAFAKESWEQKNVIENIQSLKKHTIDKLKELYHYAT